MSKLKPVVLFFTPIVGVLSVMWASLPSPEEPSGEPIRPGRVEAVIVEDIGIDLPPVEYIHDRPTADSLSWRVAALIRSNPDQEFAREMEEAVISGKIAITWLQGRSNMAARFYVVEPTIDASVHVLSAPNTEVPDLIPVIEVSVHNIINMNTRKDAVFMQLVLQHEFEHYKQWLAEDAEHKLMSLKLNQQLMPPAMEEATGIPRREVCAHMIESEVRAYTVECTSVLARQTPRHLLPEICEGAGTPQYAPFIEATMRAASPEIWRLCP